MSGFSKKKLITVAIQLSVIAILIYIDYFIKNIVVANIPLHGNADFIKGVIGWTYEQNTGMAWSMFDSNPELLSLVTGILLAAGFIYLILPFRRPFIYDIVLPLIAAGGTANLIDRISRGYVVDYIKTLFVNFPVYNFADCLITCGAAVLIVYLIYEIAAESKNEKEAKVKQNG